MRKDIIILTVLLLVVAMPAVGQVFSDSVSVGVTEYGATYIPSVSQINIVVPLGLAKSVLDKTDVTIWYLAYSPFLIPVPFAEIGALFRYFVVDSQRFKIGLGAGTAIEFVKGAVAVPAIASLDLQVAVARPVWTGLEIDTIFWSDGFALEALVPLRYEPAGGFRIGLGAGGTAYFQGSRLYANLKFQLCVGYAF